MINCSLHVRLEEDREKLNGMNQEGKSWNCTTHTTTHAYLHTHTLYHTYAYICINTHIYIHTYTPPHAQTDTHASW